MELSWTIGKYLRQRLKSPQKGITTLLEASLWHLLITPPSHLTPQKDRGLVGIFFERGKVYPCPCMVTGLQILSREILGNFRLSSVSNFRQKIVGTPNIWGVALIYQSLRVRYISNWK